MVEVILYPAHFRSDASQDANAHWPPQAEDRDAEEEATQSTAYEALEPDAERDAWLQKVHALQIDVPEEVALAQASASRSLDGKVV